MAAAFVQQGKNTTTIVAALAITFLNVGAGNHLTCSFRAPSASTLVSIADSQGNTWVPILSAIPNNNSSTKTWLYHAENVAAGTTIITVTLNAATNWAVDAWEHSGIAISGSLDVSASLGNATSTTPSVNYTPTQTGDAVVAAVSSGVDNTWTVGANFGNLQSNVRLASQDRISTGTAQETAAMTLGTSTRWTIVVAAFKEAAAGGGIAIPVLTRQYRERMS